MPLHNTPVANEAQCQSTNILGMIARFQGITGCRCQWRTPLIDLRPSQWWLGMSLGSAPGWFALQKRVHWSLQLVQTALSLFTALRRPVKLHLHCLHPAISKSLRESQYLRPLLVHLQQQNETRLKAHNCMSGNPSVRWGRGLSNFFVFKQEVSGLHGCRVLSKPQRSLPYQKACSPTCPALPQEASLCNVCVCFV